MVSAAGTSQTQTVEVRLDPRLEGRVNLSEMIALRDVQLRIGGLMVELTAGSQRLNAIQTQIRELNDFLRPKRDVPPAVTQALGDFSNEIRTMNNELFAGGGSRGGGDSVMGRLMALNSEISGITGPLPSDMQARIDALVTEIQAASTRVYQFITARVPELNRSLNAAGIPFIQFAEPPPGVN